VTCKIQMSVSAGSNRGKDRHYICASIGLPTRQTHKYLRISKKNNFDIFAKKINQEMHKKNIKNALRETITT
jgi:hypothetical protein